MPRVCKGAPWTSRWISIDSISQDMYTIFYLIGIYALTEYWPPASKLASYDEVDLIGSRIYVQV